jgi:hypothetical protein
MLSIYVILKCLALQFPYPKNGILDKTIVTNTNHFFQQFHCMQNISNHITILIQCLGDGNCLYKENISISKHISWKLLHSSVIKVNMNITKMFIPSEPPYASIWHLIFKFKHSD